MDKKQLQLADVLKHDERVVSLTMFQTQLILATTRNIYSIRGNKLYPIELIPLKDEEDAETI